MAVAARGIPLCYSFISGAAEFTFILILHLLYRLAVRIMELAGVGIQDICAAIS